MLISECIECGKEYNRVKDGKRAIDRTHGICPDCFKKVRELNKEIRERAKREDRERRKKDVL